MRKPLIIYLLLLPMLLGSPVRIAAAVSGIGASSPWSDALADVSEPFIDDHGVSVDNLFTGAPRFHSVPSNILAQLGLVQWSGKNTGRLIQPPRFLLNLSLLI